MPKLTVEGVGEFDVPQGKRLVLALEDDAHIDQLHACDGNARCTTCRVEFVSGEPEKMTVAEKSVLAARGLRHRESQANRQDKTGAARHEPSSVTRVPYFSTGMWYPSTLSGMR
ncbi:MAG TPA: 2Fe-2S iron-sulfur cluster-binding protein [Gemmataceae bacterium]